MQKKFVLAYFAELLGTFTLVFACAGVVCVNHLTTPRNQTLGLSPATAHQPGLVGIALTQAAAWTVLLVLTVPISGGYLNPAITLTLWLFRKIDTVKMSWLIGAQLIGAVLAGLMLRNSFEWSVLNEAHFATPHINHLVYPHVKYLHSGAGLGIEVLLTFFLVFAIFGGTRDNGLWISGLWFLAGTMVFWPLTGACANPARWFGTCLWESQIGARTPLGVSPWADMFVYLVGPSVGSLLAGWVCFRVLPDSLASTR